MMAQDDEPGKSAVCDGRGMDESNSSETWNIRSGKDPLATCERHIVARAQK